MPPGLPGTPAANTVSFFGTYRSLFGEDGCVQTRSGASLLAYDTLETCVQAVQYTRVARPSPDGVLAGIGDISGGRAVRGVSGEIDYPTEDDQAAVPRDKAMVVMRVQQGRSPERELVCGRYELAQPPPDACAPDRR